jgi:hypothetical protein
VLECVCVDSSGVGDCVFCGLFMRIGGEVLRGQSGSPAELLINQNSVTCVPHFFRGTNSEPALIPVFA